MTSILTNFYIKVIFGQLKYLKWFKKYAETASKYLFTENFLAKHLV